MSTYRPADGYPVPLAPVAGGEDEAGENGRKKGKKGRREKEERKYERSVETLFRTAYDTHVSLTAMADGKASILITINGLVLSVLLASISTKIDTNEWLLLPTSVLLLGCLGSMICAILAVRPRIDGRPLTLETVRREHLNLLFFGNYISLSETEYRQAMAELVQDPDRTYSTMTRDLYGMGSVLGRKFRLLRHSYDLFMGGLVLGVLLFIGFYVSMVI